MNRKARKRSRKEAELSVEGWARGEGGVLAVDALKRRPLVGRREAEEAVSGMQVEGWTWWMRGTSFAHGDSEELGVKLNGQTERVNPSTKNGLKESSHASHQVE